MKNLKVSMYAVGAALLMIGNCNVQANDFSMPMDNTKIVKKGNYNKTNRPAKKTVYLHLKP